MTACVRQINSRRNPQFPSTSPPNTECSPWPHGVVLFPIFHRKTLGRALESENARLWQQNLLREMSSRDIWRSTRSPEPQYSISGLGHRMLQLFPSNTAQNISSFPLSIATALQLTTQFFRSPEINYRFQPLIILGTFLLHRDVQNRSLHSHRPE